MWIRWKTFPWDHQRVRCNDLRFPHTASGQNDARPALAILAFASFSWLRWKGKAMYATASFPCTSQPFACFFPSEGTPLCPAETGPHAWRGGNPKHNPPSTGCECACGMLTQSPPRVSWWNHVNPKPCLSLSEPSIKTASKQGLFHPWSWNKQHEKTGPSGTESTETLFLYFSWSPEYLGLLMHQERN